MGDGTGCGVVISCCCDGGCRVDDDGPDTREEGDCARMRVPSARKTPNVAAVATAIPPGRTVRCQGRIDSRHSAALILTFRSGFHLCIIVSIVSIPMGAVRVIPVVVVVIVVAHLRRDAVEDDAGELCADLA